MGGSGEVGFGMESADRHMTPGSCDAGDGAGAAAALQHLRLQRGAVGAAATDEQDAAVGQSNCLQSVPRYETVRRQLRPRHAVEAEEPGIAEEVPGGRVSATVQQRLAVRHAHKNSTCGIIIIIIISSSSSSSSGGDTHRCALVGIVRRSLQLGLRSRR